MTTPSSSETPLATDKPAVTTPALSADQRPTPEQLQAKITELSAANDKLLADNKAQNGRGLSQREIRTFMQDIAANVAALQATQLEIIQARQSGSGEADRLAAIQTGLTKQREATASANEYAELLQELKDAVLDETSQPVLDLDEAPELEHIRNNWITAGQARDFKTLSKLVREARTITHKAELKAVRTTAQTT